MTTSEEYYSKAAGCFQDIAVPKRGEYEEFDLFAIDPTEEQNLYRVRIPYYFRFRGAGKGFKAKSVKPGSKRFILNGYEELGLRNYSIFENIASARKCLEQLEDASKKKEESEFIELLKTATNRLYDSLNALAIIVNSIYGPADYMLQPNIDNAIKSLNSKGFKDLASILEKCSKCYSLREYRYIFTHKGTYKLIYSRRTYRPEDI